MSNLGMYETVTTAAKQAGGMENYLALVKDGAVAEAAPAIFGKGALAGAAVAAGLTLMAKRYWDRRALRIELGKMAEAELKGGER